MRPGLRAWDILRGRLRASLSHFMETACVFVDGENLRHSIVELFEPEFQAPDYLPRAARWSDFFEHLVKKSGAKWLLRSYWYVVGEMDFWPWGLSAALRKRDYELLERVLSKDRDYPAGIRNESDPTQKNQKLKQRTIEILGRQNRMRKRFEGWKELQEGIAERFDSIEFRRAGSIRYNLYSGRLGAEKAVDVHLATDLLKLSDIYDVAIIVSGDQDYVPAVQAVKDYGKQVINVSFLKKNGKLLPGGARRLNRCADRQIQIPYSDMHEFMGLVSSGSATTT